MEVVTKTELNGLKLLGRGKVRDIYDLGETLLIVTTDRLSAFDVILPEGIPFKGYVLTKLSEYWFRQTSAIVDNHLITTDTDKLPDICNPHKKILEGRSMLVRKAQPFPVECVARGYIAGSGWKDYKATGAVCGIKLPSGLLQRQMLPDPIFTPARKEEMGMHDENISYERSEEIIGKENAAALKALTLKIYVTASGLAAEKGIIIADTKFEFGKYNGKIILIDEAVTPDSSRFWRASEYKPGETRDSMDKQIIRNYLEDIKWGKTPPAPNLPPEIVKKTSDTYLEIMDILIN
ncbi:MAG: phosphoribosylaminoimidazolesuccinocarboxamide synthase [Deferribacteraceae bacterium]|jgi:phosphoribosylaminoimidazole-succinocarboxamide synthase|nr:phosphoribosylaminoimidazolesuccinocarboxamide synthase [Deferribacteraceae bacterium]